MTGQHAATRFAGALVALAEGRVEPADWLACWAARAAEVEEVCPRGWFLRLTPRGGGSPEDPLWTGQAMVTSRDGACYVLDRIGIPVDRPARYTDLYGAELARWDRDGASRPGGGPPN